MSTRAKTIRRYRNGELIATETIEVELTPEELAQRQIASSGAAFRASPGDTTPPITTLPPDATVTASDTTVSTGGIDYTHVTTDSGVSGWVRTSALIRVYQ